MRKCIVQRWIPQVWITKEGDPNNTRQLAPGTGCISGWLPATFHMWGVEGDEGATTSVAIVEFEDGTVDLINTHRFKFL